MAAHFNICMPPLHHQIYTEASEKTNICLFYATHLNSHIPIKCTRPQYNEMQHQVDHQHKHMIFLSCISNCVHTGTKWIQNSSFSDDTVFILILRLNILPYYPGVFLSVMK